MNIADIPTIVAQLKTRLAALGDGRDCRSPNEQAEYRRGYDSVQRVISGLSNEPREVENEQADLDTWTAHRDAYLAKEKEIEQAIETAPDYTTIADARARDHEQNRQLHLQRQLELLRAGGLYRASGVTFGALEYIDRRIAELTQRRDRAQMSLDAHLKEAEQLLGEPVTS
jgi:hypothetical protein